MNNLSPTPRLDKMALWHLYAAPIRSLARNWPWKLAVSSIGTFFWWAVSKAEYIWTSVPIPPSLIFLVAFMWTLDFFSGIFAVVRDEGVDGITSIGLRQSIVKFIEYAFAIASAGLLATFSNHLPLIDPLLNRLGVLMCFFVSVTEFRSIDENLRWGFIGKVREVITLPGLFRNEEQAQVDSGDAEE